jgi:hypothetical protein
MTPDFVVAAVIVVALVIVAFAIRGSIRRGPTLAQRYEAASPEEKRRLDEKMESAPWLRAKMEPLSKWSLIGGVVVFFLIMMVRKWLEN